jgi:replicative DNA helicase
MERNQGDKGATIYTLPHLINLYNQDEANRTKLYPKFYSTLESLKNEMYGFSSGELVVVAAPPAMGKRPFVISLIMNLSEEESERAVGIRYFSMEHTAQTVFKHLLTNYTGKPLYKLEKELGDASGEINFLATISGLMQQRIVVDEERFEDYLDLVARIRHDQLFQKSEVFVLDYLQLLGKCRNSVRETNLCIKALKGIAKEFDVLIIVLTRISRSIEKRKKRIPALSDLCEQGKFDHYANHIFMLHRPEYYGFIEDKKGRSQGGIMKVYGWRMDQQKKFKVKMRFQWECNRVIDL